MAAEGEEVVVGPDLGQAEDVGEQLRQGPFDGGGRCPARPRRGHRLGRWQGRQVELAVGVARNGRQWHERRRDQVVRQDRGQVGAQPADERGGGAGRRRVVGQRRPRVRPAGRVGGRPGHRQGRRPRAAHEQGVEPAGVVGARREGRLVAEGVGQRVHVVRVDRAGLGLRRDHLAHRSEPGRGEVGGDAGVGDGGEADPPRPMGAHERAEPLEAAHLDAPGRDERLRPGGGRRDGRPGRQGVADRLQGGAAQHDVEAVLGELVTVTSAPDPYAHLEVAGPGHVEEERGRDHQLLLQQDAPVDGRREPGRVEAGQRGRGVGAGRRLGGGRGGGGCLAAAGQLDRAVEEAQPAQVPDVADEQRAARGEQVERAVQHRAQVVGAGEVLDHRVDDDRVEERCRQPVGHVGRLVAQLDPAEAGGVGGELGAQLRDDGRGEVRAPVLVAAGSQLPEQQAGADPDLQHAPRRERPDPLDGPRPPLPHVLERDRLAVVAGVPAVEALRAQRGRDPLVLVGVDLPPLADLVGLDRGPVGGRTVGRHDVGDEALRPRRHRVVGRDHGGLADRLVAVDGGGDLAQFDPVATDLDLVVGAAQEVEVAVVGPAGHQVTGAVHPPARAGRVGDEPGRGQAELVQIAAGQAVAGDVQLAGDAVRDRAQPAVEHVDGGVADRPAHGGGPAVGRRRAEGVDRVLGRAVEVVAGRPVGVAQPVPDRVGHGLAAQHDQGRPVAVPARRRTTVVRHKRRRRRRFDVRPGAVGGRLLGPVQQPGLEQVGRVRRGDVDDVDPVAVAVGDEALGVAAQVLVADVHLVALDEPEKLLPRHVERERDGVRDPQPAASRRRHGRVEDLVPVVEPHVRQPAVGGDDALGPAGRSRRVDHVGRVVEPVRAVAGEGAELGVREHARGGRGQLGGDGLVVEHQPGRGGPVRVAGRPDRDGSHGAGSVGAGLGRFAGEVAAGGPGGDHQLGPRVGHHLQQAGGRMVQLQRQVGGAGAQDGEQGDDHVHRPADPEGDDGLRAGAVGDQEARQPVHPVVELAVGQPLVAEDQRDLVAEVAGPVGEQVGHGLAADRPPRRRRGGQPVPLGGQQQIQGADRGVEIADQRVDRRDEPGEQRLGHRRCDDVGAVLQASRDPRPREQDERQRVVGVVEAAAADDPVAGGGLLVRDLVDEVLQDVEGVEQHRVAAGPLDVAEAEVLVVEQVEALLRDPAQQLADRLARVEPDPDRDGVQKQPDDLVDPVELGRAAGDGRAEHDVVRPGRRREHQRERGVEDRVQGDAVCAGGRPCRGRGRLGQLGGDPGRRDRPQAPRRRHHQRRALQVGQRRAPGLLGRGGVPLAQPHQVVPERAARRGRGRRVRRASASRAGVGVGVGGLGGVGGVEVQQPLDEQGARPAVPQQHLAVDDQPVAPLGQVDQDQAEQRWPGDVERAGAVGGGDPLGLGRPVGLGQAGQVDLVDRRGQLAGDDLHRAGKAVGQEAGAQRRGAGHQRPTGAAQPLGVEPVVEVEGELGGVGVAGLVEGRVEVQALLQRRERPDVLDRGRERAGDPG